MDIKNWVVWIDKENKIHCAHTYTWDYAVFSASEMTSKVRVCRDMSKSQVVLDTKGIPFYHLIAPTYTEIDHNKPIQALQAWAIQAPTRYQAIKLVKQSYLIDTPREEG